jgi:hypothetical protein
VQVGDVPGDAERLVAAAPLPRLKDAERVRDFTGQRRGVPNGGWPAVQDDYHRPGRAIGAYAQSV